MKNIDELTQYLSEGSFMVDELGRIVIEDQELLSEINGAFSSGDAFSSSLINGACSNGAC
jgi:hypothetical protein